MNDEQWRDDLIEACLRYLRGQGDHPGLANLEPQQRDEACQLLELLDAITDMGDVLADPVAGLPGHGLESVESAVSPAPGGVATKHSPGMHARQTIAGAARARHRRLRAPLGPGARWPRPLGTVAAAMCVIAASLFLLPDQPVGAVEVGELTASCETSFGGDDASADDGSERVVVAAVWGGEERKRFEEVLGAFAAETGIDVDFATSSPEADSDMGATLRSLIEQGCAPDVALLPQPGLLRKLAGEGHLQPIDDVAGDVVERNYTDAWQQLGRVDGVSYGVWFKAANKSIIWYNARAFERAGISHPPADWEALKEVADLLLESGITPFSIAGGEDAAWTLTDWFENVYLRTAGRDRYEALASGAIPWTDPSVEHALQRLAEIFDRPEWIAGDISGALQTSYKGSIEAVFADPHRPSAAMVFEGDFVAGAVPDAAEVGVDARFFAFPAIGSSESTVVGTGSAANPVEAAGGDVAVLMSDDGKGKELLRFLATPDAAEPWVRQGGFTSPNRNVNLDAYPSEEAGRAASELALASSLTFDLTDLLAPEFGSTPGQGMWRILRDFLADPTDVAGAAQRLQESFHAAGH